MRTVDKKRYDRKQGLHPETLNALPIFCIEYIPLPLHVYACLSYAWAGAGGFGIGFFVMSLCSMINCYFYFF